MTDERRKRKGEQKGGSIMSKSESQKEKSPSRWKWRGVPVWYHDGMICTGETYKCVVKVTFAKGAALEDPSGIFNSSLDGNTRRAID
jgi:hypothetical protein